MSASTTRRNALTPLKTRSPRVVCAVKRPCKSDDIWNCLIKVKARHARKEWEQHRRENAGQEIAAKVP